MHPFSQLLTQTSGSTVAPETLEMLGRQASQMFQSGKVPLNDAIAQVMANHPELSNEHINRVVEFANTVTFQEMFQNSPDKNVHFDVADPGVVNRDLKDGGTPAFDGRTNNDYNSSPKHTQDSALESAFNQQFMGSEASSAEKMAGSSNLGRSAIKNGKTMGLVAAGGAAAYAGARGAKRLIDGKEKTASEIREDLAVDHELHANPVEDVYDSHVRLKAARTKLAESYEAMNGILKRAQEELYQNIKYQVMDPDGAGMGGVLGALEKVAEADILEVLLTPMTHRLMQEGLTPRDLNQSMEKRAGQVPNMDHPLFTLMESIMKVASEMVTCSKSIDDLDVMIDQTGAIFKKAGDLTTGVKNAIGHKGHVPDGIRQRFPKA